MTDRQLWIAVHLHPDAAWPRDYFPDDLPEAWRPVYLGNEMSCVLCAPRVFDEADAATLESWVEALETGLRAFLDDAPASLPEAVAERPFTHVVWDETSRDARFERTGRGDDGAIRIALARRDDPPQPAATRALIEAALEIAPDAPIVLAFDGAAAMQHAQQARTVAAFMGW